MTPAPELMRFLESFEWPGNVRQLRNCLESMVVMARGQVLNLVDLPVNITQPWQGQEQEVRLPPGLTLADLERRAIEDALERYEGNRTHAARSLGISVRTLQRKLKAWRPRSDDLAR